MNKPQKPKANESSQRKTKKTRAKNPKLPKAGEANPSTYREELHLKYPPQNRWENVAIKDFQEFRSLFFGDWENLVNEDRMPFDIFRFRWRSGGSPFDLLQLLWAADKLKVYPPISVLSGLAKAVESYFLAEGKSRFDECLGLVGKQGERNYFTESTIRSRDAHLCEQMETLRGIWKVTIDEAAAMVASANPNSLSEDTIKFRYSKNKNWKQQRTMLIGLVIVYLHCWSTEDRQNFLNTFPLESLPLRLKPDHPLYNPKDPGN